MSNYLIIGAIVFLVAVFFVLHNSLVNRKNQVENALGSINAYLKKRYDLIPNLVATIKNYMQHEDKLLTELTRLRSMGMSQAPTAENALAMDQQMSAILGKVMVSVENYPDLKANTNFVSFQNTLHEIEEQLSAARRTYNAAVTSYNNGVEMLPSSLVAAILGYKVKPVFQVTEAESTNPSVGDLFKG